jgi:two-component system sensor histidine kinase KdpD
VVDESERLNRFIANLLDMTKIESGAMEPNGAALCRRYRRHRAAARRQDPVHHRTELDIPADLPMLKLDPVLFEQVLFNLLDNAAKYAPSGSTIRIRGWADGARCDLQVMDEGPGIPPADLERVFDTFYRVRKGDHVRAGTGLGLSICRGFVEAMGGTIAAGNRPTAAARSSPSACRSPAERPKSPG